MGFKVPVLDLVTWGGKERPCPQTPLLPRNHGPPKKGRCSPSERRRSLLDAARDVFLERGFANATIDAVVERAGGSKATVYALFENKEGLSPPWWRRPRRSCQRWCRAIRWTAGSRTICATSVSAIVEILIRPEQLALFRLVLGECGRVPEVGEIFFRTGPQVIFRKVADMLRSAAARGQIAISDAEGMAHFFIDALRGHVHMEVMLNPTRRPTQKEIERHVDFVVANFLRACRLPTRD